MTNVNNARFSKIVKERFGTLSSFYEMLKDKELSFEKLEEQINKVNEVYEIVLNNNQEFNDKTDQYNREKMDFYKNAGIEVSSDKEK